MKARKQGTQAVLTSWRHYLDKALSARWSAGILLLAGVLLLGIGYWIRPVNRQEVILLTHQSYELPGGGSLSLVGEGVREQNRTLTGIAAGTATVRIGRLTEVEEYDVSVFAPQERGEPEQRVGVDSYIALAPNPKEYPVVWRSSDPSVATVEEGVVTGVSAGTASVTEVLNDYLTYTYQVTVVQPELEQERFSLYPWQEVPLKVRYYSRKVDWTSDSDAVQVNSDGKVTTTKPGRALLTTQLGDETLSCQVQVAQLPSMEKQLSLRTDETAQLHVRNALGEVSFHSEDEKVVKVDQWGHITPVSAGITKVTASFAGQSLSTQVTVFFTAEEQFRLTNYGPYQPETSVAALAMLGMCDYYNDTIKASKKTWYDTNMTNFSPADTFQKALDAKRQGANCNSLLNWSWHDMGIKPGSGTKIYGQRDSGDIHGYNGSTRSLRSIVDECCTVTAAHGEKTSSLEHQGKLQSGDMLFMPLHTFIYRGKGTVFASAGDAKHRRRGKDLIILDCINGYRSYDWHKRITYVMRFKDDYIPRYYRNKEGEVVENPMYSAQQKGESPWTGKLSPTQRKSAGLEPVTFRLGDGTEQSADDPESETPEDESETEDETALEAEEAQGAEESPEPGEEQEAEESSETEKEQDTGTEEDPEGPQSAEDAPEVPLTGDITAEIPQTKVEETVPRMAGGKPYGSWPSTGKKAEKKKKRAGKSKAKESGSAPAAVAE